MCSALAGPEWKYTRARLYMCTRATCLRLRAPRNSLLSLVYTANCVPATKRFDTVVQSTTLEVWHLRILSLWEYCHCTRSTFHDCLCLLFSSQMYPAIHRLHSTKPSYTSALSKKCQTPLVQVNWEKYKRCGCIFKKLVYWGVIIQYNYIGAWSK